AGTLGVCFDTAHGWAAGYDCGSKDGITGMLEQFDKTIGLKHLLAIHINDSKAKRGSRVDRHEHIGHGAINPEGFKTLLNQNWPGGFPFILETPDIGSDWDRVNLEIVRSLLK
ncbi:MAG: TIM barrel protein, partial [Dethiobacter sp.]|nr:TIM barrel protein [Dethiobacter sp.]